MNVCTARFSRQNTHGGNNKVAVKASRSLLYRAPLAGLLRHQPCKHVAARRLVITNVMDVDKSFDEGDIPEKAGLTYVNVTTYVDVNAKEVRSLNVRLEEAMKEEEEMHATLKKIASKRLRLEAQVAAETAANKVMEKALELRKTREGSAQKDDLLKNPMPAMPVAKPAAVASSSLKGKKNLKNLMRNRLAKKKRAVTALKEEVAVKVNELEKVKEGTEQGTAAPASVGALMINEDTDVCNLPKPIFVISDCTGESAANTVRCALGQFEQCVDQSCPTNLVIFRFVNKEKEVYDIFEKAQKDDALVVTSLVADRMMTAVKVASKYTQVNVVDLWSGLLDQMEGHLDMVRSGVPLGRRKESAKLSAEYFRMIEAVEYTRKMDDGSMPENWPEADLLLLGVSRTGKTPLSIYLGQRGYKVANLPLVPINGKFHTPKQLFTIDRQKVIGLLIDPELLLEIRMRRMDSMGVERSKGANRETYDSIKQCREEVAQARAFYEELDVEILDVTARAVEETAARILRMLSDRQGPYHPSANKQQCSPGDVGSEAITLLKNADEVAR